MPERGQGKDLLNRYSKLSGKSVFLNIIRGSECVGGVGFD